MNRPRVLVVEDEGVVAEDVRLTLNRLGYDVSALVSSGEKAVEKAAQLRPDLVLMDIRLKGEVDGMESAEQIRIRFDIPVVYLTAYADEDTLQRAKLTEPYGYLLKPLGERELHTTIEMALYKHRMERRLRESERWLTAVLESIGDGVIATDAQDHIRFMNPVAEALTGWKQGEVLGEDSRQVLHIAEGTARSSAEVPVVESLQEGGVEEPRDYTLLVTREGAEILIDSTVTPIEDERGCVSGVVRVFRDITERVQLEQRLRVIYQLGRELTLLHDEVAIFQRALEMASDMLQYEAISYGLVDEAARELVYRQRLMDGVMEPLALRLPLEGDRGIGAAVAHSGRAINVPDTSQDPRYVSLHAERASRSELCVPMKVGERVIGVLNVESVGPDRFTPADQQLLQTLANQTGVAVENARLYRRLQEQMQVLQETQAQLIRSEKMAALGRLVASVAHEINNPLQAVQGGLGLTREELGGQARREKLTHFLDLAEEGVVRIAAIVGRVADFYRPGRQERRPTDLHVALEEVLELAGERLHQSDVTVERAWADTLPRISANPEHLQQVFLTLVLNAVDAMGHGGTLRISTSLDQPDEEMVRIAFSDTGVGMSPEIQARLFEPFFTTKAYASRLGLPISYQIIEGHGGEIAVTSEEGVGTTFTILLPVTPVTDDMTDVLAERFVSSRLRSAGDE